MKTAEQIRKAQEKLKKKIDGFKTVDDIIHTFVSDLIDNLFDNSETCGYDEYYGEDKLDSRYIDKISVSFTFGDIINRYGIPDKFFMKFTTEEPQKKLIKSFEDWGYNVIYIINPSNIKDSKITLMWHDIEE